MCCRVSFQRLLFCFLVLSLVGCDQNPQRKPREQSRESREEVEKKLEDATNQVFAEFTRRYTADGTWQESFTRSPVWTKKVEDRLIPATLWPLTRNRKFKQETTARRYILTRALTEMGRVQHTSTSLVLCFFFAFEGS